MCVATLLGRAVPMVCSLNPLDAALICSPLPSAGTVPLLVLVRRKRVVCDASSQQLGEQFRALFEATVPEGAPPGWDASW